MTALETALGYAARGWRVFWIPAMSKIPAKGSRGFKDATTDEGRIREWWTAGPDGNIGIATGHGSGIWVLDVDPVHDGERSLEDLQDEIGRLPDTVHALTGSGGQHFYFRLPPTLEIGCGAGFRPGLDWRGDGGYVVAPGSVHPNGRTYEWEIDCGPGEEPLVHAPEALVAMVRADRKANKIDAPSDGVIYEAGKRDDALTSLAGRLRGNGFGEEALRDSLAAFNKAHCKPPKSAADIARIAKSAMRWDDGEQKRKPDALDDEATDLAAAARLVARHGEDIRFCAGDRQEWYIWDGRRWARDTDNRIEYLAGESARAYTISKIASDARTLSAAKRLEGRQRITGAIACARSMPDVIVQPTDLDASPWLLTAANVTIDLRTSEVMPHDRSHMITHIVPVEYDPGATAERFTSFLSEIHPGQPDVTEFLRRWCGYCLTGETREHALVVATGSGRNGKGTLFELLARVLGPQLASPAPRGLLMMRKHDAHPTEIMALRGKRMVYASEIDGGQSFSEERLKWLTGGDTLQARGMHKDHADGGFAPTHKLVVYVNELPQVRDTTISFWERMRVVPFDESFVGDRQDKRLVEKLNKEYAGVLTWAVDGAKEWYANGLPIATEISAATQGYREESDDVGRWISHKHLDVTYDLTQLASVHLEGYAKWAEGNGGRQLSAKAFAKQLENHKATSRKTKRGMMWTLPTSTELATEGAGCRMCRVSPLSDQCAQDQTKAGKPCTILHPAPMGESTTGDISDPPNGQVDDYDDWQNRR